MTSEHIHPTLSFIKCSDCGKNVETHKLSNHTCLSPPFSTSGHHPVSKNAKHMNPLTPPFNKEMHPSPARPNKPIHDTHYGTKKSLPGDNFMSPPYLYPVYNNETNFLAGFPSSFDNSCYSCKKLFESRDDIKKVASQSYHSDCFVCRLCCEPFDEKKRYFEHEGKLYCERDHNVVKSRLTCAECNKNIPSYTLPIKVLGQSFHQGHIKCCHCYQSLNESTGWKEHQNKVYCIKDFKHLFVPRCKACDNPVEKEAVSALDGTLQGKWHPECFGCHICHCSFPDNTFYVFQDSPYCKRHYHQLNNSLCRTCDEPIEGPCAQTVEGWRFHPACFQCNVCHCIVGDFYYMFERKIYCESHIQRLQSQRNVRAEKRKTQFGRV